MGHDLLEAEDARALLKMPQAKFELLVSSGRLPITRSSGKACFRREDVSALARKRESGVVKTALTRQSIKPAAARPTPAVEDTSEAGDGNEQVQAARSHAWFWLAGLLALVAIGVALLTCFQIRNRSGEPGQTMSVTAPQKTGKAAENWIAAPGLVESASGIRNLSFDVAGIIKTVCVEEGQRVKAGQLLAELDNGDVTARLDSARAELAGVEAKSQITERNLAAELIRAQKEVERLSADLALLIAGPRPEEIARAKADVAAAQADAIRTEEDARKYDDAEGIRTGAWSVQLRDNSRRTAESAKARLDAAREILRALENGSRKEDVARARAILGSAEAELARQQATQSYQLDAVRAAAAQARAQVANAEAALKKTRLYAPIDGAIVWKFQHGGEAIDAIQRQPVIAVADLTRLRVRASVDETDYPLIAKGQQVKIFADAFGDQPFTGHVVSIGDAAGEKPFNTGQAREKLDVRVIETLIAIDAHTPLKLGLRVTAKFKLE